VPETDPAPAPVAITLDAVTVRYGGHAPVVRDVDLVVEPGTTTALLGPSGCGKTTLLRSIAGLERPSGGTIRLGDRLVSGPDVWVAPERRRVGMVFQDAALFPHLTVAQNVAFGLRELDQATARRRVGEMLDLVGLDTYADRRPGTLSGGQRQRVALARSLAPQPSVLLLDEPFSALDAALRAQLRADVSAIIREVGVTTVFVTHDQTEAFLVGDHIGVMRSGVLCQIGTAEQLYRTPADRWVAGFVGEANVVTGRAEQGTAQTPFGPLPLLDPELRGDVDLLVRPEDLEIDSPAARTSDVAAEVGATGTVRTIEYLGADAIVVVQSGDHSWRVRVTPSAAPSIDDAVRVRHRGTALAAWRR
jgi:iron(III) transport system ATP-binding protein